LCDELAATLPDLAVLVCPLAIGGHVDHRLTSATVEQLFHKSSSGRKWSLWYYADYPYVVRDSSQLAGIAAEGGTVTTFAISQNGLIAWGKAVAAHRSQISTFWSDMDAMQAALQEYVRGSGGVRLWLPIKNEQTF